MDMKTHKQEASPSFSSSCNAPVCDHTQKATVAGHRLRMCWHHFLAQEDNFFVADIWVGNE